MSLLLLLLLHFFTYTLYSDDTQCVIDEDGNQSCETIVESDSKPLNHISHLFETSNTDCENSKSEKDCEFWKNEGECKKNIQFMIFNCAKSCGFCHLKDPKIRCSRHPEAKQAIKSGGVNAMFERIINDFQQYKPKVLSKDPWVVILEDVLTEEECKTLIKYGGQNFRRSKDAGTMEGDEAKFKEIVSDARTSSTDWCVGDCWSNPIIQSIAKKAENITGIPKENSEFFQVLRYEVGQYYVEHHDFIFGHLDLPIGPRLYTLYIYLNNVKKGGGTKFNELGLTVEPKMGRVLIWPSVLNNDPFKKEMRTNHEALPVEEGVKYGANMWLHMFNFHDPYKVMCTG